MNSPTARKITRMLYCGEYDAPDRYDNLQEGIEFLHGVRRDTWSPPIVRELATRWAVEACELQASLANTMYTAMLSIFSHFLSELHTSTGDVPLGIVLPPSIFDRLVAELGPRCVFVNDTAGAEEFVLHAGNSQVTIRRSEPTRFTLKLEPTTSELSGCPFQCGEPVTRISDGAFFIVDRINRRDGTIGVCTQEQFFADEWSPPGPMRPWGEFKAE